MRVLAVAAALAGLVACGKETSALDTPHIGGERFVEVSLSDVPLPPDAEVIDRQTGERSLLERVVFETALTPEEVMGFMAVELDLGGWTVVQEPQELIGGGELATWERLGRTLAVEALPGEVTDDGEVEPTTVTVDFTNLAEPGNRLPAEFVEPSV